MTSDKTVTILVSEYEELKRRCRKLSHLEANGVDNWEGYSFPDDDEEDEDE